MLRATTSEELVETNRSFYDALWARTYLTSPKFFNTWPLIASLLPTAPRRLEVGPGLRPRLPVSGTHFVDLSAPAVARLLEGGGLARCGELTALPFADGAFDLVVACDVIEHIADDRQVFAELTRVLQVGGRLVLSVPLHPERWNEFDTCVGHARRYRPEELGKLIAAHGLVVERSVGYGMQSRSPRLLRLAVKGLTEHRSAAVRWYNWLFFPIGMVLQRRLKWVDGMIDLATVEEVLLVCRREAGR